MLPYRGSSSSKPYDGWRPLHQENLQIGVFKGYLVLMTSPLGSEGGPAVSRLANIAAFGSSDGRVFWSGYVNGAKDAAEILAERVGGKTLEMTPAGRIAGSLPREYQDSWLGRRIWVFLSRGFAGGTSDVARAVIWTDKAATIWKTVELPILNNNGIPIIYY